MKTGSGVSIWDPIQPLHQVNFAYLSCSLHADRLQHPQNQPDRQWSTHSQRSMLKADSFGSGASLSTAGSRAIGGWYQLRPLGGKALRRDQLDQIRLHVGLNWSLEPWIDDLGRRGRKIATRCLVIGPEAHDGGTGRNVVQLPRAATDGFPADKHRHVPWMATDLRPETHPKTRAKCPW